jgi:hypothetical protein
MTTLLLHLTDAPDATALAAVAGMSLYNAGGRCLFRSRVDGVVVEGEAVADTMRCSSLAPGSVDGLTAVLRPAAYVRCTLSSCHAGAHLGPHEERWESVHNG